MVNFHVKKTPKVRHFQLCKHLFPGDTIAQNDIKSWNLGDETKRMGIDLPPSPPLISLAPGRAGINWTAFTPHYSSHRLSTTGGKHTDDCPPQTLVMSLDEACATLFSIISRRLPCVSFFKCCRATPACTACYWEHFEMVEQCHLCTIRASLHLQRGSRPSTTPACPSGWIQHHQAPGHGTLLTYSFYTQGQLPGEKTYKTWSQHAIFVNKYN